MLATAEAIALMLSSITTSDSFTLEKQTKEYFKAISMSWTQTQRRCSDMLLCILLVLFYIGQAFFLPLAHHCCACICVHTRKRLLASELPSSQSPLHADSAVYIWVCKSLDQSFAFIKLPLLIVSLQEMSLFHIYNCWVCACMHLLTCVNSASSEPPLYFPQLHLEFTMTLTLLFPPSHHIFMSNWQKIKPKVWCWMGF